MDEPSQGGDQKLSAMEHVKKRHEEKGFLYAWFVQKHNTLHLHAWSYCKFLLHAVASVQYQCFSSELWTSECISACELCIRLHLQRCGTARTITHAYIMINWLPLIWVSDFFFPFLQLVHAVLLLLLLRNLRALPRVLLLLLQEGRLIEIKIDFLDLLANCSSK